MIISDEQAKAAARYLRDERPVATAAPCVDVSTDVLDAAREAIDASPDMRADRVVEAVERMRTHTLDSHDIAEKMLSRILSDALR